jgi:hypothetical protein
MHSGWLFAVFRGFDVGGFRALIERSIWPVVRCESPGGTKNGETAAVSLMALF